MSRATRFVEALMLLGVLTLTGACTAIGNLFDNPDNTAKPAELVDFEPTVQIRTVWQRSVGTGAGKLFLKLRPAIGADRIYAATRDGRVRAFDARTGESLWDTDTDSPLSGGPGVGDGLVLLGTSDGEVLALAEDDGAVKWRARVSSEVLSAPQAIGGVAVARTIDGKLFGLASDDGTRLWVYDRTTPVLTLRGTSSPALAEGAAVAGFDGGQMVAVAMSNGQPLWETRVAVPRGRTELERMVDIDADPLIDGKTVYAVTYQGQLAALDLMSGQVVWRRDMSSHAGLGIGRDNVYVTDDAGHVWALNRSNSASMWRQAKLEARRLSPPAVFGPYVIVGDLEGYVHWLRQEDGQFAARVRVDAGRIVAAPVATPFAVYVYGSGGELTALQVVQ
ncbi:MAG: outer membrane protein assembly factor BamB [Gammaproteobacteria bacterium]|nr:outer membrane protein assembly factor BamB [Gammaproteobacteria bacterium]NIM75073.1 outer membrane protein assembly factor BamB [Gammaproteobacteria bacterium]NIN40123.1 outer membrane protein assembly factor BamB [Gammaproteobacteria bacterium]NIO26610.1 outer membrane protein assembly factor BamB [Gammaproteobacteria bacterium]NIO67162.1 outer membrane protein assembly factor BamB [Gammaproteobacteria bacterium]